MSLRFTRLSPALGAIVEGFDLSRPLNDSLRDTVSEALLQHQVLFFRGQNVSPQQQRDFAAWFGDLHIHPLYPKIDDTPQTFIETPPLGSVLVARKLPEYGGDTLWASGTAAWRGLSPYFQQLLDGLTATHDFTKSFPLSRFGNTPEALANYEETRRKTPPVVHPVIRTHPVTGDKALFVSDGFTTHINELEPAESQAVLQFLFAHFAKPEYSVRWRWQPGDVAFWDNRVTQHYAVDDYRPAHRIMHRATILGDKPY